MTTTRMLWNVWGIGLLLAAGPLATSAPAASKAELDGSGPIRVLIVTGGHDFEAEPFFDVFKEPTDIVFNHVAHPSAAAHFAKDKADAYDVIVLYDMYEALDAKAQADLRDRVLAGKGLVALHHALVNYPDWEEYVEIIGGGWSLDKRMYKGKNIGGGSYKHDVEFRVQVADPGHPILRGIDDFTILDETYKGYYVSPNVHPLLTTEEPTNEKTLAWTNRYGGHDVVYMMLGHGPSAYKNPNFRRLVGNAIRYTAGRYEAVNETVSDEGFVRLFNGKDFDGWTLKGKREAWTIQDGELHSPAGRQGHWVRTDREYGDFILKLEWKVSPRGNSGVFIRAKDQGPPWVTGHEIQISNEQPRRDDLHCTGALYGAVAVDPRPDEAPGYWREYEIHAVGGHIKVFVDGIKVIDVNQAEVEAIRDKPLRGYIGLQDSHGPAGTTITYRNIRVKELSRK